MKHFFSSEKLQKGLFAILFLHTFIALASSTVFASPAEFGKPVVPQAFDKATVQNIIEKIEQNHNASILKVEYFARRQPPALHKEEGYKLLLTALEKEDKYSHRWFILQSVRAFAALRIGEGREIEGIQVYKDLFSRTESAESVGVLDDLLRANYEFISTFPTYYLRLSNNTDVEIIKLTLVESLQLYLNFLEKGKPSRRLLPWIEVFITLKKNDPGFANDKRFIEIVEKSAKDPAFLKNYSLIFLAAAVYAPTQPQRAIELLQNAKPLLQQENHEQLRTHYDTLADLLLQNNHWLDAIKVQQEKVNAIGQGYGKLIRLHLLNKDEKAVQAIIVSISSTTEEKDITEVAQILVGDVTDQNLAEAKGLLTKHYAEQGAKLLEEYLDAPRKRDVEQELRARLILAKYYINEKKADNAKKVLVVEHLQQSNMNRTTSLLYSSALRLRARIDNSTKTQ